MGWRYRKRISLGKGLRINLSKSGVSLGLGPPGANINLGRRGMRTTVGLPGTGLSYQKTRSWGVKSSAPKPDELEPSAGILHPHTRLGKVVLVIVVAAAVFGVLWLVNAP
jgi:hypothetical protein